LGAGASLAFAAGVFFEAFDLEEGAVDLTTLPDLALPLAGAPCLAALAGASAMLVNSTASAIFVLII
jgi:hypothetical protein